MWNGLVQYSNDWQIWYKIPRWIIWAAELRFLPPFVGWASPNRKEVLSCHRKPQDSSFTSFNRRQEVGSRSSGHLFMYRYINSWYAIHFYFLMLIFHITMHLLPTARYEVWQLQKKYFPLCFSKKLSHTASAISSANMSSFWAHIDIIDTTALSILTWMIPIMWRLSEFTNITINWQQQLKVPRAGLYWLASMLVTPYPQSVK